MSHSVTGRINAPVEPAPPSAAEQVEALRVATDALLSSGKERQAVDVLLGLVASLSKDKERIAWRLRAALMALYGRKTERLSAEELGQLVLALGGTEEEAKQEDPLVPTPADDPERGEGEQGTASESPAAKKRKRRPRHKGRTKLDPSLPRNITVIPVSADEKRCIHCKSEMEVIGHIDSERIRYVPGHFEVDVERRVKCACKETDCAQDITTAQRKDSRAYERRAGPSLLAHLLESKCDDALPVYRQQEQFRRLGCDIPLNTLYGYWEYATRLLAPLAEAQLSTVLGCDIVAIDDTRLDYLTPDGPRGKQRGHLWCFVGTDGLVAFSFTETWAAEEVAPWLSAIDGYVQCDDYKGYGATISDGQGNDFILVDPARRLGCMMHVRRRFYTALKAGHLAAAVPVKLIADIYRLEEEAREAGLDPPGRLALRQHKSLPLLDDFDSWVNENLKTLLPSSPLATAATYAKNQRAFVRRCFADGRFEIDNGRVEREIREAAIGRKNYLFSGSAAAAKRLADSYTMVLGARKRGLPVREYLIDVLDKLERGWELSKLTQLLPANWQP